MFVVSLILHNQHFIYLINHIIIYWPTLSTLPPPSPYPSPASLLLVIYDHSKNARPAQRVEKPLYSYCCHPASILVLSISKLFNLFKPSHQKSWKDNCIVSLSYIQLSNPDWYWGLSVSPYTIQCCLVHLISPIIKFLLNVKNLDN